MDDLGFLNGTYCDVWSPTIWLEDHELDLPSGNECATWMLNCRYGFIAVVILWVYSKTIGIYSFELPHD
jgi:hypothetical protein